MVLTILLCLPLTEKMRKRKNTARITLILHSLRRTKIKSSLSGSRDCREELPRDCYLERRLKISTGRSDGRAGLRVMEKWSRKLVKPRRPGDITIRAAEAANYPFDPYVRDCFRQAALAITVERDFFLFSSGTRKPLRVVSLCRRTRISNHSTLPSLPGRFDLFFKSFSPRGRAEPTRVYVYVHTWRRRVTR